MNTAFFKKAHLSHSGGESHLLREIVRTHQALMAGFSRKVGMTASRLALMRLIVACANDIGILDLARQLNINAAAVTRQIKEMEDERLILRRTDFHDKRRCYVKLSSKGLKLFKSIHDRSHELERALSLIISAEDIAVAVSVLTKLRSFIDEPSLTS